MISFRRIGIGKIIIIAFCIILLTLFLFVSRAKDDYQKYEQPIPSQTAPKMAGWISWWAEKPALDLLDRHPGKIQMVSPVWFMVGDDLVLTEVGSLNKLQAVSELRDKKITYYPTLGSELSPQELSYFLNDDKKVDTLIDDLIDKVASLGAEGVDINLEAIKKTDKDEFTLFLTKLSKKAKEKELKLSVTVHAQLEVVLWEGVEGHDLEKIGQIADQVRVMTYDEHTGDTKPGPIASFKWLERVTKFTFTKVPKEKIIMGIPSYGYIWGNDETNGIQYDEFEKFLAGKTYTSKRDKESGEVVIRGKDFTAWLSDSDSMNSKINFFRNMGINNFIIWHLGGMDEELFGKISSSSM